MKVEGGKETLAFKRALVNPPGAARDSELALATEDSPALLPAKPALPSTLLSYWRFLLAGFTNHWQTGAVIPSQRFLIGQMISPVPPDYRGTILELGAGTGALTTRLAERCPEARILACEINPALAQEIRRNLRPLGLQGRVEVVCDSAEHWLVQRRRQGRTPPDFIISGIPLGNLNREAALTLIGHINRTLAPGGLYVQFQYSLLDRKKIKQQFAQLQTVPVFLNFPPAVVYYARKQAAEAGELRPRSRHRAAV